MSPSFVDLSTGSVMQLPVLCISVMRMDLQIWKGTGKQMVLLPADGIACCSVTGSGKSENMNQEALFTLGKYVWTPFHKCLGLGEAYVGLTCLRKI